MMNIHTSFGQHAGLGMPASERVRIASLRALPMMTGALVPAAGQKCALIEATSVTSYRWTVTDVAIVKGAFPGISAWSPPI